MTKPLDLIVYGGEGVCRVEEIGVPKISGVNKQRQYYTLSPLYRAGKVFAPVDAKVFMRPVITHDEAVALIHEKAPWCRVLVGGAVLTEEYARKIGADGYGRDAMAAVRLADSFSQEAAGREQT